jgi:hypothetical protein
MDLLELAERVERLHKGATSGPWWITPGGGSIRANRVYHPEGRQPYTLDVRITLGYYGKRSQRSIDWALIVEMVNHAPEIVAALRVAAEKQHERADA